MRVTGDFSQFQGTYGSGFAFEQHHDEAQSQRADRRRPPARYEAIAVVIMLVIVAMMPLFSN